MIVDHKGYQLRRLGRKIVSVEGPDGTTKMFPSWNDAVKWIDGETMPKSKAKKFEIPPELSDYLAAGLGSVIDMLTAIDQKDRHVALFIFTREGDEGLSIHALSTMEKDWLHEMVREWINRETQ